MAVPVIGDVAAKVSTATAWNAAPTSKTTINAAISGTRDTVAQMDALKKHRAKAQQTVRVERVTVNEGGQAIVGDVSGVGGG